MQPQLQPGPARTDWRGNLAPFGGGPRTCPGLNLALVETRLVLAMLYRTFDVEPVSPPESVTERNAFTLMREGLRVGLRRRTRLHHRST